MVAVAVVALLVFLIPGAAAKQDRLKVTVALRIPGHSLHDQPSRLRPLSRWSLACSPCKDRKPAVPGLYPSFHLLEL